MKATRIGFAINWKHPDARGLALAMPMNNAMGDTNTPPRCAYGPTPTLGTNYGGCSWITTRYGKALKVSGATNAGTLWGSKDYSTNGRMSLSYLLTYITADASYQQSVVSASGVSTYIETDGKFKVGTATYGSALTIGQTYQVGFSLVSGASGFAYINGAQYALSAFPTISAGATGMFSNVGGGSPIGWAVSDLRIWSRIMPAATFERHYAEGPSRLYLGSRRLTLGGLRAFNGGRFFPFMHPALQS